MHWRCQFDPFQLIFGVIFPLCELCFTNISVRPLPHQSPVMLTFDEDDVEASELTLSRVSSFQKSARNKVNWPGSLSLEDQFCCCWHPLPLNHWQIIDIVFHGSFSIHLGYSRRHLWISNFLVYVLYWQTLSLKSISTALTRCCIISCSRQSDSSAHQLQYRRSFRLKKLLKHSHEASFISHTHYCTHCVKQTAPGGLLFFRRGQIGTDCLPALLCGRSPTQTQLFPLWPSWYGAKYQVLCCWMSGEFNEQRLIFTHTPCMCVCVCAVRSLYIAVRLSGEEETGMHRHLQRVYAQVHSDLMPDRTQTHSWNQSECDK